MEALRTLGMDVQSRKGKSPGWFLGERTFQLAELKLLVDAVQSSKFITQRKSSELIRKLESQASVHQARQLQRQVYVDRRVKSMNESVYYTIDKLHTAIANRKAVTFKYFEYNVKKEKVFRREGKRYTVSPLGLIWDNENYYLAGYDHRSCEMRHYRVDKMAELAVTCLPLEGADGGFDIASYAQKHFGMFSGRGGAGHPALPQQPGGSGVGPLRPGRHSGARRGGALHRHRSGGGESPVSGLGVRPGGWSADSSAPTGRRRS